MNLPINFSPVAHFQNCHYPYPVIDIVKNAIIPGSHTPAAVVFQLAASGRPRIVSEPCDLRFDCGVDSGFERCQLAFSPRQDLNCITHLRLRSILSIASEKGTGVSPDAFASSYARISSRSSSSSRIFSYSSMLKTTAIFSPFSLVKNCVGAFIVSPIPEAYSSFRPSATTPAESVRESSPYSHSQRMEA